MMLNWPFMWVPANDPASSTIAGQVGAALNPAGPAGTASIDGTDAYTITKTSADPELARKLIEFYLDPAVQKSQSIDTGWLPIRLSVLNDPEVQEKSANATVVLEQAQHPYDSFVTPDYNEVTHRPQHRDPEGAARASRTRPRPSRTPRERSRPSSPGAADLTRRSPAEAGRLTPDLRLVRGAPAPHRPLAGGAGAPRAARRPRLPHRRVAAAGLPGRHHRRRRRHERVDRPGQLPAPALRPDVRASPCATRSTSRSSRSSRSSA